MKLQSLDQHTTDKYYNYIFIDPRKPGKFIYPNLNFSLLFEPFYVGKGKNNRWKHHNYDYSNNHKTKLIKKLNNFYNYSIKDYVIILNNNQSNIDAILFEKLLIKKIGRYINKSGTLTNITEGGDGQSSSYMKLNNPMFKITSEDHSSRVKLTQWDNEKGIIRKDNMSKLLSGDKNPAAKKYLLITNDEVIIHIHSLKTFCKDNNYSYNLLRLWINRGKIRKLNEKDMSINGKSKKKLEGFEIKTLDS